MTARLPTHQLRELARWAARAGWQWERLAGGHVRWRHPNGARPIITSATSSDWRADRNARQQMTRALERSVGS